MASVRAMLTACLWLACLPAGGNALPLHHGATVENVKVAKPHCKNFYPLSFKEVEDLVPRYKRCMITTHATIMQEAFENTKCKVTNLTDADVVSLPPYMMNECNFPEYGAGLCMGGNIKRAGDRCRNILQELTALFEKGRSLWNKRVVVVDDTGPGIFGIPCVVAGLNVSNSCFETYDLHESTYRSKRFIFAKMASDYRYYKPGIDIALPPPALPPAQWEPSTIPLESRPYLATFMGRFSRHPIRKHVADLFHNGKDVLIEDTINNALYKERIHGSVFGLILRGDTRWTHRFNDVVCSGAIPVLVTDIMVPPFNEIMPFQDYGVLINETNESLAGMMKTLKQLSAPARQSLQQKSQIACRHMFRTAKLQAATLASFVSQTNFSADTRPEARLPYSSR
eukprot:gnl/TRDRNA2_/TRDRNA2_94068_c0_seq1.p1 gnl/TRDRNA2_/TRDRNA2_94068_c0~~gnl/TRDRNA2_/TRDRNA2_94068_c0_seq1.p1  ORF type:complete len:397 (+),score=4.72 gnl/TRDRNA2_/TRDRNA2_94068_c0_seq1:95-1285(+)